MPTLSLTPAEETDQAQGGFSVRQFILVGETDEAQALTSRTWVHAAEADSAVAFVYEDQPYRRLKIHKLVHLVQANEATFPESFPPLHVMNRDAGVVAETDSAVALTIILGATIFKTITPVIESG